MKRRTLALVLAIVAALLFPLAVPGARATQPFVQLLNSWHVGKDGAGSGQQTNWLNLTVATTAHAGTLVMASGCWFTGGILGSFAPVVDSGGSLYTSIASFQYVNLTGIDCVIQAWLAPNAQASTIIYTVADKGGEASWLWMQVFAESLRNGTLRDIPVKFGGGVPGLNTQYTTSGIGEWVALLAVGMGGCGGAIGNSYPTVAAATGRGPDKAASQAMCGQGGDGGGSSSSIGQVFASTPGLNSPGAANVAWVGILPGFAPIIINSVNVADYFVVLMVLSLIGMGIYGAWYIREEYL